MRIYNIKNIISYWLFRTVDEKNIFKKLSLHLQQYNLKIALSKYNFLELLSNIFFFLVKLFNLIIVDLNWCMLNAFIAKHILRYFN